ncbi:MAG TPA: glycosidase [Chloroflexia bacterium]|nr:glycosidase [Chloroflexia bacterium]
MTTDTEKFALERQGIVLEPDYNRPYEAGGVLNPASAYYNGKAYLLYRSVAAEPVNYSRIMLAELHPAQGGLVAERLDICALEPEAPYEKWRDGVHGGVEDPRVTPMQDGSFIMVYTAYGDGPGGDAVPRIALARSSDLKHWERLGLARYTPLELKGRSGTTYNLDLQTVSNKDGMLFPEKIGGRYALLHRPTFAPEVARDHGVKASIWLSFSDDLLTWTDHHLLLTSEAGWENLKTGGGTPPLRTPEGWLIFYHAVEGESDADPDRRYMAGAALLDLADPRKVLYRSKAPVLAPDTEAEKVGVVNNVVFPTGVLPQPDGRVLVIYGMADLAIGVASTIKPVL